MLLNLNEIVEQIMANPPQEGEDERTYNKRMMQLAAEREQRRGANDETSKYEQTTTPE